MQRGAIDTRLQYFRYGTLLFLAAACVTIPFLQKTPRSCRELLNEGLNALTSGDQEGLKTALEGLNQSGGRAEQAILESQVALLNSDFQQAIALSLSADRLANDSLDYTLPIRVEALYRSDQLSLAEDNAREWLKRQPDHPGAHRWLASIYYDLGAMDQARTHLESLIRLKRTDYRPHYLLGILLHDYERFTEATVSFENLLKLPNVPEDAFLEAKLRLGDCHIRNHQYIMALELLRPLSNSATALARCAECEYALGNGISAKEFLRRAVSVNESDPDVLRVGADLRMSDGEYPAAELLLRRLLELQPSHVAAHYRLAECLRLQGRNDEAIRQFKQQEEYRTLRITLSELHLEAIKDPWNADLRDRIADMFQDLGDPEKEAVWRKAAAACRDPQPASASGSSPNKQSAFPQPAGSPEEFPVF